MIGWLSTAQVKRPASGLAAELCAALDHGLGQDELAQGAHRVVADAWAVGDDKDDEEDLLKPGQVILLWRTATLTVSAALPMVLVAVSPTP